MHLARIVERNGDAGAAFADDAARDAERLGRHHDAIGDDEHPTGPVDLDAGETRPLQADAHDRLAIVAA